MKTGLFLTGVVSLSLKEVSMVQKKYPRKGAQVRVTFELPANGGQRVAALGDFNDWQPDALPMKLELAMH